MLNSLLIIIGQITLTVSRFLNLGNGSTWPGHIALSINKNFIKDLLKTKDQRLKTMLIAGTNGKTTTGKLIREILEQNKIRVIHNESGANLLNGLASALIQNATLLGKINANYAIFEIDENTLPLILKELNPDYLVLLNLFRDQLDRYGEVNIIADRWRKAIEQLSNRTIVILNADDPQIAGLCSHIPSGSINHVLFFGLSDEKIDNKKSQSQHASDSTYCTNCGSKLEYATVYYSHLGDWKCLKCKKARPKLDISESKIYPLHGIYNRYNTLAAILVCKQLSIKQDIIDSALKNFKPAFGRQEILNVDGKKVQIFLSKNPTSFNESLRTITDLNAKNLLLVLNDRIPDGRDVSWIWDIDTEDITDMKNITVSGDRAYDMGLRLKYSSEFQISNFKFQIEENLKKAIILSLEKTPKSETLYILPTYSAMLEVRKILTGRKIL